MAQVGNLLFGLQCGILVMIFAFAVTGTPTPVPRNDDPMLEIVSRKNWSRASHCPTKDGSVKSDTQTGWKIDDIDASVEGMNATAVIFIIDNKTPRDFETLKMRIFLAEANTAPTDLELGQIVQFSMYRFEKEIQGVSKMEDIKSVQVIEGMHFYKIGVKAFQSYCSKSHKTYTEVTVQHEKNYAHSLANIHYLMNSPEFRRDFMVVQTIGTGWMERQRHLDWLLATKKYHLTFRIISSSYYHPGHGDTHMIALKEWLHNHYNVDINSFMTYAMAHELYHYWSYGHSDFALKMQHQMCSQLKKFSEQGVVQPKIAPQERYTDFVGLNAVYNPVEEAVYIFSGYSFRILSMKEWRESNLEVKDECLSRDPVTGRKCTDFASPSCKLNHFFYKTTTVFGNPCKDGKKCTVGWTGPGCYDSDGYNLCYPPCSWKYFGTGTYWYTMPIYGAMGQVDVESVRHCVRYDESCAWNDAENCKRYRAYSGNKATTVSGEACLAWKSTSYMKFETNYCRASPGYGPWCYKVSGGWDYCFAQCKITLDDYKSPVVPENDELPSCFDIEKGCAWNRYRKCKFESKIYEKTTTRLGETCKNGTKCQSGDGFAPFCFKESKTNEWDYCFYDCIADLCLGNDGTCFKSQEPFCKHYYLSDQVFNKTTTADGKQCDSTHNRGRCTMKKGDSTPQCMVNYQKENCYKTCTRHPCVKDDESCAWNKRDVCKSDTAAARYSGTYTGGKNTTASGVNCKTGTCKSVRKDYSVYAPSCSNGGQLCFNDCYEPSQDERSLVDGLYKDVRTGVKFAFLDTSGSEPQIGIVPFIRGQKPDEDQILYYSLDQKTLTLKEKKPLKDVLGGLWGPGRTLYNPQFLQGVGVFHGAQFCPFTGGAIGNCTNIFTDPNWTFLNNFEAGPAELDLVFDGGHGKAFFFKEKEFIVYDLSTKKMVDGYPKPVSTFLHMFGLLGQTFVALS